MGRRGGGIKVRGVSEGEREGGRERRGWKVSE